MSEKRENIKAKRYQQERHWLTLISFCLILGLLSVTVAFDVERWFIPSFFHESNKFLQLSAFFLLFSIYFLLFQFPLSFYSGFVLERKFNLTNHTLKTWFFEMTKRELLSFGLAWLLVLGLYALIWQSPEKWWFYAWMAYTAVSLVLGILFPVLIVPLFYRYTPLAESTLRTKIMRLAERFQVSIDNVYMLNLSKTTKKANAAFCGMGKTKRVILADTLVSEFSEDEIESVVAHELGHYKHRDIWRQFGFGSFMTFIGFWLVFYGLRAISPDFGNNALTDIAGFPMLCLLFYVFSLVIMPIGNTYSRHRERLADQFALEHTPSKTPFISTMQKLCRINLADAEPNPIIEFLLHDHPSIASRIDFAEKFKK